MGNTVSKVPLKDGTIRYLADKQAREDISDIQSRLASITENIDSIAEATAERKVDEDLPGITDEKLPPVVTNKLPGVVSQQLPDAIENKVETWLGNNVDPSTGYVVDKSLSIEDAAADAKTVGDKLTEANKIFENSQESLGADYEVISSAYIDAEGVITSQLIHSYDVYAIKINPNDRLIKKISVSAATDRLVYAFYKAKPSISSVSYNGSRTLTNSTIVTAENVNIPTDCTWIAIRVLKGETPVISSYSMQLATTEKLEAVANDLAGILDPEPTRNLFDKTTLTNNLYINENGNIVTDADIESALNYITSDYIKTSGAIYIKANGIEAEGVKFIISRYDSSKNFIGRLTPHSYEYQFGNSNGYIRLTFIKSLEPDFNLVQVENGTVATDYIPHRAAYDYNARMILKNFEGAYESGQTNLVDDSALILGMLINENGAQEDDRPNYNSTYYIDVTKGFYILRSFEYSGSPTYRICTYDSNKTKVRRLTPQMSLYPNGYVIEITEAEKFVRITFQSDVNPYGYQHKNVFVKSVVADKYLPYNSMIDSAARLRLMQTEENLFPEIRKTGAMFSICDDDTTSDELVEIFHDICADENILGCYAVITFRLNNDPNIVNRLKSYEENGFGMYYHCKQQVAEYNPSTYDESVVQPNFIQGIREFKNYGFLNDDVWVVPFGGALPAEIDMAKRAGMRYLIEADRSVAEYERYVTTEGFNLPSKYLNRYCVLRKSLGFGAGTPSIAQIKASIDECVEKGGWIIFMTHANTWYEKDAHNNYIHDEFENLVPIVIDGITGPEKVTEILQYCKSKNMKNITIKEGLSMYEASYTHYETVNQ